MNLAFINLFLYQDETIDGSLEHPLYKVYRDIIDDIRHEDKHFILVV